MADNLIIKIDGDASYLERELNGAAGTGVRAFKSFGKEASGQLSGIGDRAEDTGEKLGAMGDEAKQAMQELGSTGRSALSDVGREADSAGKRAQKSMVDAADKSGSAWNKVKGIIGAIAGAAVVKQIISIGKEAIGLASDLDEVQNVIDVTFGEGNTRIENFAKGAAKQFGVSELSAKKMMGTMGAMLKSLDVDNVDDMSMSLVGLAADMGSFYNMDAEEAFAKLRSGISGETEPLKQLGINMSVANLEAYALSQGIKKQFKDMTAAEQATLRYNYIMKATADAQGDFSRTSGSMANQLKIAQLNVENMKAALGKALLPAATAVVTGMNNFITNVQRGFPLIKETITNFVQSAGAALDKFGIGQRLTAGLSTAKKAINEAIGFVMKVFQSAAQSPVLQSIGEALKNAFAGFLSMWDSIGELLSTLWIYLEPVWEGLKAGVSSFVDAFLNAKLMLVQVVEQIYNFIKGAIDIIIGILTLDKERIVNGFLGMKDSLINIAKTIWKGLGAVLTSIWNGITRFLSTLWEKIKKKAAEIDLKKNGKELLDSLKKGIDDGWNAIKTWFAETKEKALKKIDELDLKTKGSELLGKLKDGLLEKWEAIKTWFDEKKTEITSFFENIDLGEIGKNILNSLKKGIESGWDSFVGSIESKINSLISQLPDSVKDALGIGEVHLRSKQPEPRDERYQSYTSAGIDDPRQNHGGMPLRPSEGGAHEQPNVGGKGVYSEDILEVFEQTSEEVKEIEDKVQAGIPLRPSEGGIHEQPNVGGKREDKVIVTAANAMTETSETVAAASESLNATADTVADAAEAAEAAAEGAQTAAEGIMDDGVQFSLDDTDMQSLLDALPSDEELKGSDEDVDYLEKVKEGFDWLGGLFQQKMDDANEGLGGINNDMNDGFNKVAGGGEGGTSEYTLLDEYNELMGLWSNNKDANGEWIADWSEGGIGDTLNQLIGGKMPGKYWGDLTPEDLQRMAGMTASSGYVQGQYQAQFAPAGEPVTVPAVLDVQGVTTDGAETGDALDLTALTEGVPEEALLSWEKLNTALTTVMETLSGGEGGEGLSAVLTAISNELNNGIPAGVTAMSSALTGSLPSALQTAMTYLGQFSQGEDGELKAEAGNNLYTSLGAVKVLFEDTDVAIEAMAAMLKTTLPAAIVAFNPYADAATGRLESMWMTAANAAAAFGMMAAQIAAVVDQMMLLNGLGGVGGTGTGGGEGGGVFAAAHGGLVRGVGVVGENGAEVISTSRNLNVFTNRALEIAQEKVAGMLSRDGWYGGSANQTNINNDNSRSATVNVGTVLGADWLGAEIDRRITRAVKRELFYAG